LITKLREGATCQNQQEDLLQALGYRTLGRRAFGRWWSLGRYQGRSEAGRVLRVRRAVRWTGGRKFFRRKKVCKFCVEKIDGVNYKDVRLLQQFVAESGKIVPRRLSLAFAPRHQRSGVGGHQAGAQ